jgi:hypothetical protein
MLCTEERLESLTDDKLLHEVTSLFQALALSVRVAPANASISWD